MKNRVLKLPFIIFLLFLLLCGFDLKDSVIQGFSFVEKERQSQRCLYGNKQNKN